MKNIIVVFIMVCSMTLLVSCIPSEQDKEDNISYTETIYLVDSLGSIDYSEYEY